ncbi:unnamed protein product [Adineta steineri]|uniref:Uncharacterized protein n=2 Tax=Adineta steineri TaxID=433720 RepID=A0A819KJ90_9BILA|nr:unnamed protein product [Adineta steineri]
MEKVLLLLRIKSTGCLKVDIGLRDATTNKKDYELWSKRVSQSELELKIINSLIDYINENTSSPMDPKVFMKLFTQCKWNRLNIRLKMFKKQLADEEKLLKGV